MFYWWKDHGIKKVKGFIQNHSLESTLNSENLASSLSSCQLLLQTKFGWLSRTICYIKRMQSQRPTYSIISFTKHSLREKFIVIENMGLAVKGLGRVTPQRWHNGISLWWWSSPVSLLWWWWFKSRQAINYHRTIQQKEKSAYKSGKIQIWSVPEIMVSYQHQLPGYHNVLCLYKILSFQEAG